jgi:CRISPR-associated protein Cst1
MQMLKLTKGELMLKLTGFVLPDVGILTLTLLSQKTDPATVTRDDLNKAADRLEKFYSEGVGKSLATTIFPNSGFVQSAFDKPQFAYKRKAWANFVLRGHQQADLEPVLKDMEKKEYREMVLRGSENVPDCVFSGNPAYLRVSRDMFPMINGRGIINFSPMGEAGLPVSAEILLAIHAMPLGCMVTQGGLLAPESDNVELMFELVQANYVQNQKFMNLADQNDYDKLPNQSSYKTHLMDNLMNILTQQDLKQDEDYRAPSVNAYHFSNYGTNARMTVLSLPSSTLQFVWEAQQGARGKVWEHIIKGGRTEAKPQSEELKQKSPKLTQRNLIWEDIFDLPEDARRFLRTYFLRQPLKQFKQDPRANYNSFSQADLISWDLTALFLKRIMNMEKTRIDQIRILGDRLADYIRQNNDRKLLRTLYQERRYHLFRMALLRAMKDFSRQAPEGSEPLVSYDGYVGIFEEGGEFERIDWNLARDLLLIRIFEQLHHQGYLAQVSAEIQDETESEEAS